MKQKAKLVAEIATPKRELVERLEELWGGPVRRLLGHHETERLRRAVLNLLHTQTVLTECDPRSVLLCVLQAAYLNLDPSPSLGHVYFVPFDRAGVKEAQLLIGYRGWMELAYRSGKVELVQAQVVHRNDQFTVRLGLDPRLEHVPRPTDEPDGNDVIAAYAIATLTGGVKVFDVLWRREIEQIKARSRAASHPSSPWNTDFEAMARAKAVRRLVRWLPKTVQVQEAVTVDEYADAGIPLSELETQESLLARLAERRTIGGDRAAEAEEEHEAKDAARAAEPQRPANGGLFG